MSAITILVEDENWRLHPGLRVKLKRAAEAARKSIRLDGSFSLLLADDKKLRALNFQYRGRDKPTNVLSFPAKGDYVGDIAIGYGITRRQARLARKSLCDHASHLVVHAVLHLAGYDHKYPKEAKRMESLEVKILRELGIADPYDSVRASDEPQ